MSLRIQNNVEAFNAHRNLVGSSQNLAKSMERLSSGYRINRAADDAAGLAISERLRAQTRGLGQAQLGDDGRGFASVDALYAWAQNAGRAVPAGEGPPRPGDLIVWDEHVGIVEGVLPDGSVQTIEGNSSDRVSRRTYPPGGGGAIGYVRVG